MFDNLSYKRKIHEILHQQHLLAFFLLCKLFCELAEHRNTNAYELSIGTPGVSLA